MTISLLTEQLITQCEAALTRFFDLREQERDADFYTEVKPYADEWHPKIAQWAEETKTWLQSHPQKYLHAIQIDNTKDQLEQLTVQSFFRKTSKKRFTDTVFAARYTLQTLQRLIKE
ncbi:hypothetical protein GCM10007425_27420 [Lysinibacillus alkalisoli]|uniref:DUF1798 family protein n=1 Tax=Lysinibacillus alkalisoli TaxID=1911548 RepID=A0A917LJI2_9BACI|nr:YppE family protein [Lysinibacillus alkalisoli]GGG31331.1 hypothetical protein GCM10007425_27420 [Lysinibacillus alkalisoli]